MTCFLRWCILCVVCCMLQGSRTARADQVRVTGAFTTFTGVVTGNVLPAHIWVNPAGVICGLGTNCSDPFFGSSQICPDAGCNVFSGMATNFDLGTDPHDSIGTKLFFQDTGTAENELSFRTAGIETYNGGYFKLGTLTFENGAWTGNADFGFTITARLLSTGKDYNFTGFAHMALTLNNHVGPQAAELNADYIYLTDPSHNPLVNPLNLEPLGSLRAYEGGTATATLYGALGSLDPAFFADVTGGGFLDPSTVDAPAGLSSSVPEPSTEVLLGFAAVALLSRRTVSVLVKKRAKADLR